MRMLKFAAPIGLAAVCLASAALADNINYIRIKNPKGSTVKVEYAVGNSQDCAQNKVYNGIEPIPPGAVFQIKITPPHPKFCCLRVFGNPNWAREGLAGGKDYDLVIN
jgi:hypothetical protein